jgi:hypothetical protein
LYQKGGTAIMYTFQLQFARYNPVSDKDKIIYAEVFDQFNVLIEKRRLRLNAVNASLPSSVWLILFLGAFVNIALTRLLVIKKPKIGYNGKHANRHFAWLANFFNCCYGQPF